MNWSLDLEFVWGLLSGGKKNIYILFYTLIYWNEVGWFSFWSTVRRKRSDHLKLKVQTQLITLTSSSFFPRLRLSSRILPWFCATEQNENQTRSCELWTPTDWNDRQRNSPPVPPPHQWWRYRPTSDWTRLLICEWTPKLFPSDSTRGLRSRVFLPELSPAAGMSWVNPSLSTYITKFSIRSYLCGKRAWSCFQKGGKKLPGITEHTWTWRNSSVTPTPANTKIRSTVLSLLPL